MSTIWFMKGFSNLYHAIADLKNADIDGNFKVLCTHINKSFVGFESADFFEVEPTSTDQEFLIFCKEMIVKYKVKVIFASNKQYLLSKNSKFFKSLGVEVVTAASYRMINNINNKAKLYKLLENNGVVNIPDFMTFSNDKEFEEAYKTLKKQHQQLCMKPVQGVYGVGFYVLKEKTNQLKNVLNQDQVVSVRALKSMFANKKFHKMMMMQFLEGAERSVDCVAYKGEFIGGVIRKKMTGNLPQLIEDNPALIEQARFLTKKLKLNGMFNIQFKDYGGEHYLLEINPRLSGRSFYATIAGLNLPYVASLVFSGMKKPSEINWELKKNLLISAVNAPVISTKNFLKIEELNTNHFIKNENEESK